MKSEILRLRKLEQRTLCVSRDGIVCFPTEGKKTKCFKGQYSDIRNWATSNASFRLVNILTTNIELNLIYILKDGAHEKSFDFFFMDS